MNAITFRQKKEFDATLGVWTCEKRGQGTCVTSCIEKGGERLTQHHEERILREKFTMRRSQERKVS